MLPLRAVTVQRISLFIDKAFRFLLFFESAGESGDHRLAEFNHETWID